MKVTVRIPELYAGMELDYVLAVKHYLDDLSERIGSAMEDNMPPRDFSRIVTRMVMKDMENFGALQKADR